MKNTKATPPLKKFPFPNTRSSARKNMRSCEKLFQFLRWFYQTANMLYMSLSIPFRMLQQRDALREELQALKALDFQFLLGCYGVHSAIYLCASKKLSIPFGMLQALKVSFKKYFVHTFNSFWDATDYFIVGKALTEIAFQFLLGCYKRIEEIGLIEEETLSIPFGMLQKKTYVIPVRYADIFQFLLGCYGRSPRSRAFSTLRAFNSFWDATCWGCPSNTWEAMTFNSFWDATSAYLVYLEEKRLLLSIPFGMLRLPETSYREGVSTTFNSFWDATCTSRSIP